MNNPLYDRIGAGYDTTRKADPEICRRLYNLLQVPDNRKVVDLACGSGNYTIALARMGLNISGVDISETMLKAAKKKSRDIKWHRADIESLPFPSHEYGGALCTLAIHHFRSLHLSFREIYRVLACGSRFVIFTAAPEQMKGYWLNEYFPEMMAKSIERMPDRKAVTEALTDNGFTILGYETFVIQRDLQDFFLYSGKYRPEIYLLPEVRAGISSFASMASPEEVEHGIKRLESDIRDGTFRTKALKYGSDLGDYMFVIAEKPETAG
mgnify:CR=1 FL=1|jgi:Methylase involved in ubiquinone/menaquinone biosynthesis